jgi:hypothetical protein
MACSAVTGSAANVSAGAVVFVVSFLQAARLSSKAAHTDAAASRRNRLLLRWYISFPPCLIVYYLTIFPIAYHIFRYFQLGNQQKQKI